MITRINPYQWVFPLLIRKCDPIRGGGLCFLGRSQQIVRLPSACVPCCWRPEFRRLYADDFSTTFLPAAGGFFRNFGTIHSDFNVVRRQTKPFSCAFGAIPIPNSGCNWICKLYKITFRTTVSKNLQLNHDRDVSNLRDHSVIISFQIFVSNHCE